MGATTHVKEHLKAKHTGLYAFSCIGCNVEFDNYNKLRAHLDKETCNWREKNLQPALNHRNSDSGN